MDILQGILSFGYKSIIIATIVTIFAFLWISKNIRNYAPPGPLPLPFIGTSYRHNLRSPKQLTKLCHSYRLIDFKFQT